MMNKNKLFTGIMLIVLGLLFLLVNLGYLSIHVFFSIFDLWPLILVVVGINILFRNKPILHYITWILFFVILIAYGVFINGAPIKKNKYVHNNFSITKSANTSYGELNLGTGAARLTIDSEGENLLTTNQSGRKLIFREAYKNNKETAILSFKEEEFKGILWNSNNRSEYSFKLNKDIIWDLDLDFGAVSGDLNLAEVPVKSLDLDFGAGDLHIILGTKYEKTNVKIDSGASNLDITMPNDAGIKIKLDTALTKTNVADLSLNKSGDYYISSNYEEAPTKLDFDIDMGAGKIDFKLQ